MKTVKRVVVALIVVLFVIVTAAVVFLNRIVQSAVETVGPALTGTSVTLDKVKLSPFSGRGDLRGLRIGNPEGFSAPHLLEVDRAFVSVELRSLMSDRIVIRDVTIEGPRLTYETSIKGSNLSVLMKRLESKDGAKEKPAGEKESGPGKKVQIDHFLFTGAKVAVSGSLLRGKTLSISLPAVELNDIGKEDQGASAAQVIGEVCRAVVAAVGQAVKQLSSEVVDPKELQKDLSTVSQGTKEAVQKAGKAINESTRDLSENIRKLLGK